MSQTAIVVLVDVSESMKNIYCTLQTKNDDEKTSRLQSVFESVIQIASEESGKNNCTVSAVAFGIRTESGHQCLCDMFSLLKFQNNARKNRDNSGSAITHGSYQSETTVQDTKAQSQQKGPGFGLLITLLQNNGAPYCSEYVHKYLSHDECQYLHTFYSSEPTLLAEIVKELPAVCRDNLSHSTYGVGKHIGNLLSPFSFGLSSRVVDAAHDNERLNARAQVKKCMDHVLTKHSQPGSIHLEQAVNIIKEAAEMDPNKAEIRKLTKQQLDRVIEGIEPYIYGSSTPMCAAVSSAYSILINSDNSRADWKMLVIMTDGYPTDGEIPNVPTGLKVNIATCLIADDLTPNQCKALYYKEDESWGDGRRALFRLCTNVPCRHPAIQFLRRRKWNISERGEVRLFAPVNDPEAIEDFTTVAQSLANSGDATANLFARVALDEYINNELQVAANNPHKQYDATCYAYATATVFHLVMKRIQGRDGGVPAFKDLYGEFVKDFGTDGANTEEVVKKFASKYRLKYRQLNIKTGSVGDEKDQIYGCEARQALNAGRPLIATYRLSKQQREKFNQFYKNSKQGVLTKEDLGEDGNAPTEGHAVVLIHCDPVCLVFLNSRGKTFADNGLFRVADNFVLNCKYYEVYWEQNALTECEKEQFTLSGYKRAHDLARQLPDSIKRLHYRCPSCSQPSAANEYTGNFVVATCPKCKKSFIPAPIGFIAGF
ncbi:uncharacterized protein LOC129599026 isoform X2 [Paramacrobiotus metropolitanus]|uniref:uncharacterized protein LOC129599026 isoform X2 n=1 Tax=Paramacrobiotus metropolitanus TaxID=2943436 RepID=UPI002445F6DB|nr:uncharacterized protein LOC129599026 isoform X2 [Paramacrobiotus metropolitanus]